MEVRSKLKGYEADPYCVYQNMPEVNNVFNRNIRKLNRNLSDDTEPDNLIRNDLNDFKNDMKKLDELEYNVTEASSLLKLRGHIIMI